MMHELSSLFPVYTLSTQPLLCMSALPCDKRAHWGLIPHPTLRPLSQTRVRTGGVRGKKVHSRTQWTLGIQKM